MSGCPLQIPAIARAAGYAAVAAAIAATTLHFRHDNADVSAPLRTPSIVSDPLAPELARCQAIGMAARNDAACEAAWATNRRRFFTGHLAEGGAGTPTTDKTPAAKPQDQ